MRNKPETAEMNNEIPQDTLRNSAAKVNVNDLLRRVRVEQKKEKKDTRGRLCSVPCLNEGG